MTAMMAMRENMPFIVFGVVSMHALTAISRAVADRVFRNGKHRHGRESKPSVVHHCRIDVTISYQRLQCDE